MWFTTPSRLTNVEFTILRMAASYAAFGPAY
jgi:hypothetical protein